MRIAFPVPSSPNTLPLNQGRKAIVAAKTANKNDNHCCFGYALVHCDAAKNSATDTRMHAAVVFPNIIRRTAVCALTEMENGAHRFERTTGTPEKVGMLRGCACPASIRSAEEGELISSAVNE